MNKLIDRLFKLFISRENVIGQTTIPTQEIVEGQKVKGDCKTLAEYATPNHWLDHLQGRIGLGLSPILSNNKCRWAALDIDDYKNLDIVSISETYRSLPIFFCRTKSGGIHLYVFFKRQFPAKEVKLFLDELSYLLKFHTKEIFPKQERLAKDASANWINLPYFNANSENGTNRYCVYNGIKLTLEQFIEKIEANLIDNFEEDLLKKFTLAGAPPCLLKMYADGVVRGYRDAFIFNVGVFLKQKYKTDWEERLKKCNQEYLSDPLPDKEVENNIIKQISKKDVFYKCKSDLESWCDKKACQSKRFGLTIENSPDALLGAIRKVKTQPPIWEIVISEGEEENNTKEKVIKLSTSQLRSYDDICNLYLEETNILLPTIKKATWETLLRDKLKSGVTEIEAPEDATEDNTLRNLIKQFCIKKSIARNIDDTSRELVFKSDGYNLFTNFALTNFLKSKQYNIKAPVLWDKVRDMGGKQHRKNNARLWALPLFEEQSNIIETRKEVDWDAIKKEEDDKEAF
jgi:hypothetical protein